MKNIILFGVRWLSREAVFPNWRLCSLDEYQKMGPIEVVALGYFTSDVRAHQYIEYSVLNKHAEKGSFRCGSVLRDFDTAIVSNSLEFSAPADMWSRFRISEDFREIKLATFLKQIGKLKDWLLGPIDQCIPILNPGYVASIEVCDRFKRLLTQ